MATNPTPVLGGPAVYRLTALDAQRINGRRSNQAVHRSARFADVVSDDDRARGVVQGPDVLDLGLVGHVGNPVSSGQPCAALIVSADRATVNLQVFLDGNDTHWVTGVLPGDGDGQWSAGGVVGRMPKLAKLAGPAVEG